MAFLAKVFCPTTGCKKQEGCWWAVSYNESYKDEPYVLLESYDNGETWIANSTFAEYMQAMRFIQHWMNEYVTV